VAWRGQQLEWTTLTEQKRGWDVAGHGTEPLSAAPDAAQIQSLAAQWPERVWLTLPAAQALLRVVTLPTVEAGELRGMAELQLDKFSPFTSDTMVMALEVLSRHEKSTRVLIAAAQRDVVAALAAPILSAGLLPAGVGIDMLGWWRNLRAAGQLANQGHELVVILTAAGAELMAQQDGQPLLFRTLGQNISSSTELIEELHFALLSLEAEWGAVTPRLTLWRTPDVPTALVEALQAHAELRATIQDLSTLPSLTEGVARRVVEATETTINLVLPEWPATAQRRKIRRRLTAAATVVGGLWALSLVTLIGGSQWQQHRVTQLQHDLALLEKPAAEVRQQQARLRLLQQYADPTGSALECLRNISTALPDGVKITSLTFAKGQSINLRGEADDAKNIYTFQQGLKNAACFKQVQLHGITPPSGKRAHTGFGVTLSLGEEEQ
jgi:Tfp pilus assembly protein PilN